MESWLKTNAPVSSFEASAGGWFDRRRQRDQAKAWINDIPKPPRGPIGEASNLEEAEEESEGEIDADGLDERL